MVSGEGRPRGKMDAFGIGGRDIAAAELEKWVRSLKSRQE